MKNPSRSVQIIISIAILAVGIVGTILLTKAMTPTTYNVVVAVSDINAGDVLVPAIVSSRSISIGDPSPYILSEEVELYGYQPFVAFVGAGEIIPKSAISLDGNPAASSRYSLGINNPEMVAMAIPVNPQTIPQRIVIGDRVDILLTIGSATFLTGPLEPVPTPLPFNSGNLYQGNGVDQPYAIDPTPTAVEALLLPISKRLVSGARIIAIEFEQEFSSSSSSSGSAFIDGDISVIVVAIPRSIQEAMSFAVNNGFLTITVLDPNSGDEDFNSDNISPAFVYNDLIEFLKVQRLMWVMTPQPENGNVLPSGAAAVVPTVIAELGEGGTGNFVFPPTYTPTPTMTIPPTATPAP